MDAIKKFQKYEVGSIAQLIADANKKKSKETKTEKDEIYDSKLSKIFKKNSEEVAKSGLKLPIIPSFTKYVPIMANSVKVTPFVPSPLPEIKLKNKDAAAIRIEARNNNRKMEGTVGVTEVTATQGSTPNATPSNKKLKDKARKLRWRNQKKEKLKELKSKQTAQNDRDLDVDPEIKKKKKGTKRKRQISANTEDSKEETVQDIPKAKKEKKNVDNVSSDDDDDEASKSEEKPKLSTAELNKPKEKNDERESRTVFVGNVPTKCKKKELKKLFKNCGTIEAVRFRGITPAKPNALKKIALRKNELHPDRNSMVAYVRFTTKEDAEKGVEEVNGVQFKEHHLSVDMAGTSKSGGSKDNKKAVFIGNLHLKTEDEELRDSFKDCGPIHSVRIIRDQATGLGKGFGYVNFETSDAVELALIKTDVLEIRNRTLRISRCVKKLKSNANSSQSYQTKNPKEKSVNGNEKPKIFGGDRLAEIGKLKRKSKGINIGERKKASVARQLAGKSGPRPVKRTKKSQGERQRPKQDGQPQKTSSAPPRPPGQGQGQGQRQGQEWKKRNGPKQNSNGKSRQSSRYFAK